MSNTDHNKEIFEHSQTIKKEMINLTWWCHVDETVATKISWIIDNILLCGVLFRSSFTYLFMWEVSRRSLQGESTRKGVLSTYMVRMLNSGVSDEVYQSGIMPTKSVLNLPDYLNPSDADVMSCIYLCNKIEQMEKDGILKASSAFSSMPFILSVFHVVKSQDVNESNKLSKILQDLNESISSNENVP